ncbi:MAG: hypothetical protein IJ410_06785 [Oscillospiraceae bacterium]|nr:hypothetical protein [Oscillospiraceae bacterium]
MMPEKEYIQFARTVTAILKDCFLAIEYPDKPAIDIEKDLNLNENEVDFSSGRSSLTKGNTYIFHKEKTLNHKQELLDICKSLPKLKTIVTGTAGTIAYTDLLPDKKTTLFSLKQYCMHADKFIGMLSINEIGYPKDMVGTDNFQAAPINLMYEYKDQVNPDAE